MNPHPRYIMEESNFDFKYFRLRNLDIPGEKWLKYLQTVETLIKRRVQIMIEALIALCIQACRYQDPHFKSRHFHSNLRNLVRVLVLHFYVKSTKATDSEREGIH